jgi:hypothetical protein
MKSAIYIEDGVVQLVLTPTDDFEKNALTTFKEKRLSAQIFDGSFYKCQGGWNRHGGDDSSLILRIEKEIDK